MWCKKTVVKQTKWYYISPVLTQEFQNSPSFTFVSFAPHPHHRSGAMLTRLSLAVVVVTMLTDCTQGKGLIVTEATLPAINPLQWRHDERDGLSNHQRLDGLANRLFKRISKKTSTLRVTSICAGNSPVTGEFRAQRASNAENVSIQWRHHALP